MRHLRLKAIRLPLAGFFLMYTFGALASIDNDDYGAKNDCTSSDAAMKQCEYFAKGYIVALLKINEAAGLTPNMSAFEKRVYETRVGKTHRSNLFEKELNLCLPEAVSVSEVLVAIDNEQPLQQTLLKTLQTKYPCQS